MAPVPIKCIISFSSQDSKYPAENLVSGLSVLKWLGSPSDRSGRLETTLHLQSPCLFSFIDIGTIWAFSLQILVGKSTWSSDQEYKTLLSGTTLMTPKDCRQEQNKQKLRMYKYDEFTEETRDESWDRVKIVLTQPFRKDRQMGISLLRFTSKESTGDCMTTNSTVTEKGVNDAKPAPLSSGKAIQKHFFGNKSSTNSSETKLQARLIKMESSTENGSDNRAGMSRHARLVMAAVSKTPRYKEGPSPVTSQTSTRNELVSLKKNRIPFDKQVDEFLLSLDRDKLDLDKVTFADLRHKLEKKKCRKLSKEEKAMFFSKALNFINDLDAQRNKTKKRTDLNSQTTNKANTVENTKKVSATLNPPDLGASPQLLSRKRASLSKLVVPNSSNRNNKSTQDMNLQLDSTQKGLLPTGSTLPSQSTAVDKSQSGFSLGSTEDLNLQLESSCSVKERSSNTVRPRSRLSAFEGEPSSVGTQDLHLNLSATEGTEDLHLHMDTSGTSDDLSAYSNVQSPEQKYLQERVNRNIRETKSTLNEQKSFISQVQGAFVQDVRSTKILQSKVKNKPFSSFKHPEERKVNKKVTVETIKSVRSALNEENTDNLWLNAKQNTSVGVTTLSPSHTKLPGQKRKREAQSSSNSDRPELDSENIPAKRRRKAKSTTKQSCPRCNRSFAQRELTAHIQLCGHLSSDSEIEELSCTDSQSQIESLLAERSANKSQLMATSPAAVNTNLRKLKKSKQGKKEKCVNCQKLYSKREMVAHKELCNVLLSDTDSEGFDTVDVQSQVQEMLAERRKSNKTSEVVNESDRRVSSVAEITDEQVCPICGVSYPADVVAYHVEECISKNQKDTTTSSGKGECPICNKLYDIEVLEVHANQCADIQ